MQAITQLESQYRKPQVVAVRSGDTVRVHQLIREGNKQRVQMFEGVVIRTDRINELSATVAVRRIASGVGVEKTFLLHSPNVQKIEVVRRAKVRRNFLSYLRGRRGKSARLQEVGFDRAAVNTIAPKAEEIASEDAVDAAVTELEADTSVAEDVSTEEVAKQETKAAAADEVPVESVSQPGDDEAELPQEEAQAGLDRAQKEDD